MDIKKYSTWREIIQQPLVWKEELDMIKKEFDNIEKFIDSVGDKKIKVIFTGAGSSEFIGNSIFSYINSKIDMDVVSIPTTDIVSMPEQYLEKNVITILISYARSGNSPESVAAVKLADELIENIYHIFITCNSEGELAKLSVNSNNKYLLLMPKKSHDKSFAMTSSFSSMMIAGILILLRKEFDKIEKNIFYMIDFIEKKLDEILLNIEKIIDLNIERIVYLGDGALKGIAEEVSLKILELTSGKIVSFHNSFLGFRHGPKAVINNKTLIVCMMSNNSYTRLYELDLLKELKKESIKNRVIVLDWIFDEEIKNNCEYYFSFNEQNLDKFEDVFIGLGYLIYGQLISLVKSFMLGINPDNPCPTGEVNRVVKGVNIYNYKIK